MTGSDAPRLQDSPPLYSSPNALYIFASRAMYFEDQRLMFDKSANNLDDKENGLEFSGDILRIQLWNRYRLYRHLMTLATGSHSREHSFDNPTHRKDLNIALANVIPDWRWCTLSTLYPTWQSNPAWISSIDIESSDRIDYSDTVSSCQLSFDNGSFPTMFDILPSTETCYQRLHASLGTVWHTSPKP